MACFSKLSLVSLAPLLVHPGRIEEISSQSVSKSIPIVHELTLNNHRQCIEPNLCISFES